MLKLRFFALFAMILLTGCQSVGMGSFGGVGGSAASAGLYREGLPGTANWAVLPFVNFAEGDDVTTQLERMLMVLLPSQGVIDPRLYPESEITTASNSLAGAHRLQNGRQWAMQNDISFAFSGEVNEWMYDKAGRPRVALNLIVTDIRNGEVIWSISGASEGLQGDDLFDVGRGLLTELLQSLPINRRI